MGEIKTDTSNRGVSYSMLEVFTVAFFGHRYIDNPIRVEHLLEQHIQRLIRENEYTDFLVGRNGEFDQCVASAITRMRKNYRSDNNSLVLVLPYPTAEYLNNEEKFKTITAILKSPTPLPGRIRKPLYRSATGKWWIERI